MCYFLLLGLAFLFVEIAFIQRFVLFLGHPIHAVAVVPLVVKLSMMLSLGCQMILSRM